MSKTLRVVGIAVSLFLVSIPSLQAQNEAPAPPGEMVDIENRSIHLNCSGAGFPVVVLEAAIGGWSIDWERVQPLTSEYTRTCSYDRAGMGWSDSRSNEIVTSEDIANDLYQALNIAGEEGPWVLVGHSLGGLHVQQFTYEYKDEVAGVVLVDSSHADQFGWEVETYWNVPLPIETSEPSEFSLDRINWSAKGRAIVDFFRRNPKWNKTTNEQEAPGIRESIAQFQDQASFPNVPLIVLSAGEEKPVEGYWTDAELMKNQLQRDLATLSPRSQQVFVPNSGHYIQLDQPLVVNEAIQRVVSIARSSVKVK